MPRTLTLLSITAFQAIVLIPPMYNDQHIGACLWGIGADVLPPGFRPAVLVPLALLALSCLGPRGRIHALLYTSGAAVLLTDLVWLCIFADSAFDVLITAVPFVVMTASVLMQSWIRRHEGTLDPGLRTASTLLGMAALVVGCGIVDTLFGSRSYETGQGVNVPMYRWMAQVLHIQLLLACAWQIRRGQTWALWGGLVLALGQVGVVLSEAGVLEKFVLASSLGTGRAVRYVYGRLPTALAQGTVVVLLAFQLTARKRFAGSTAP